MFTCGSAAGKVRFRCSLRPNATPFSTTIPAVVGTKPFHKAVALSSVITCLKADRDDVLGAKELDCSLTFIVSKG